MGLESNRNRDIVHDLGNHRPSEQPVCLNNKDKEKIDNINELFEYYLYPILKWSRREDYKGFTKYNIDEYKNLTANDCYTYLKRLQKSMPIFQITEPTDNGKSFFEMVEHYRSLAFFIISECKNFLKNNDLPVCGDNSYNKAKWLFYCATLMYYDRFACELEAAIKKTFTWAFALYVKQGKLQPTSPNKYIRETSNIFYDIKKAKSHTEITRKYFDYKLNTDINTLRQSREKVFTIINNIYHA